jgi:membrane protein implicated in regulation of membrane protease activity
MDPDIELNDLLGGLGLLVVVISALAPGFLVCLILLLPLVIPLIVLAAIAAIPLGVWRIARAMRSRRREGLYLHSGQERAHDRRGGRARGPAVQPGQGLLP